MFDLSQIRNRIVDHLLLRPAEILSHPGQAWEHPTAQAEALVGALREIGIADELKVYRSPRAGNQWVTIDGHLRKSLDPTVPWPCAILDVTDAEADYLLATFDPIGALKQAEPEALRTLLEAVSTSEPAVQKVLDEMADVAGLFKATRHKDQEEQPVDKERAAELQARYQTAVGQIWRLGPHRLMCGDCTDPAHVAALLGPTRPVLAFTSPPYNAGSTPTAAPGKWGRKSKYQAGADQDKRTSGEYLHLLSACTELTLAYATWFFVNLQMVANNKVSLLEWLYQWREHLADVIIWDKTEDGTLANTNPAAAERVLNSKFEFIFALAHEQHPNRALGTRYFHGTLPNIYAGPPNTWNALAELHAAVFPVHLPQWAITNFTNPQEPVYDPFLGTGTTLVAADATHRVGFGMELNPIFCAVALDRLETATHQTAELVDGHAD